MGLPSGIATVTVTGTYATAAAEGCLGTVTFVPVVCELKFPDIPVVIAPGPTVATVGPDGTFTVTLVASDASAPVFAYEIVERLTCLPCARTRTAVLTAAGSPYNIADLPEEASYGAA